MEELLIKEIWKPIKNYKGLYEVSSYGRIKSLSREVKNSNKSFRTLEERIITPKVGTDGYYILQLYKNGNYKNFKIHQLVAIAFLNHKPQGYSLVVDHKNCEKLNNHVYNLQIITHRENCSKDKKGYSSKYVGVYWVKGRNKWRAQINIKGKEKFLGEFKEEIDAHNCYQNKLKEIQNGVIN